MKSVFTIALLVGSYFFMTFAWCEHLKLKDLIWFENARLVTTVFISWGLALFEYFVLIPANKIGYSGNSGTLSLL